MDDKEKLDLLMKKLHKSFFLLLQERTRLRKLQEDIQKIIQRLNRGHVELILEKNDGDLNDKLKELGIDLQKNMDWTYGDIVIQLLQCECNFLDSVKADILNEMEDLSNLLANLEETVR